VPEEKEASFPAPEAGGELMYVRCAFCGAWLDVKPERLHAISHGLCPTCLVREERRLEEELKKRKRQRSSGSGNDPNAG